MKGKAIELAKIFSNICIENEYETTKSKIQKLLYFAQGMYIAEFNKADEINNKLFDEKIYNWNCGPVIQEVDEYFKDYEIKEKYKDIYWMLLTNEKEITEKVFDKYGNKSSVELREKCIDDLSKINVKDIGDEITPEDMYNIFANHKEDK